MCKRLVMITAALAACTAMGCNCMRRQASYNPCCPQPAAYAAPCCDPCAGGGGVVGVPAPVAMPTYVAP